MKKMVRAELTAFLSLLFLLLLSLTGALIQAASIQIMKNERRADASRAMESVYAEYQKELFDQYGILGIEATYETGEWKGSYILNRLSYYGMENMETEIEEIQLLTDHNGKPFFTQAVQYQKEKSALSEMDKLIEVFDSWQDQSEVHEWYEDVENQTMDELDDMLEGGSYELPTEDNPLSILSDVKSDGLLNMVIPKGFQVSKNKINLSEQVSHRTLRTGTGLTEEENLRNGDTIFFHLYLDEHFKSAADQAEKAGLCYEMEYLLSGKGSDEENLEAALKNVCHIRFLFNYGYLLTDEGKKAEARVMAGALCSMIPVAGIQEVMAQAILLAWAYGESVMDLRVLMEGGKIELMKTKEDWQLSLQGLLELRKKPLDAQNNPGKSGLTYKQYLQMMLVLKKKELLSMRALDLIELQIAKNEEKTWFRADYCVVGSTIHSKCRLERGITYQFSQTYQYQ